MKIRTGFVSNSSSSSFICTICGDCDSGWDLDISDSKMMRCCNNHVFCKDHGSLSENLKKIPFEDKYEIVMSYLKSRSYLKDEYKRLKVKSISEVEDLLRDTLSNYLSDAMGEIPEKYCPVCTLKEIPDKALVAFIKHFKISDEELKKEIRSKFQTLDELEKAVGKIDFKSIISD